MIALFIPSLADFLSLEGSFFTVLNLLCVPFAIYIKLYGFSLENKKLIIYAITTFIGIVTAFKNFIE